MIFPSDGTVTIKIQVRNILDSNLDVSYAVVLDHIRVCFV